VFVLNSAIRGVVISATGVATHTIGTTTMAAVSTVPCHRFLLVHLALALMDPVEVATVAVEETVMALSQPLPPLAREKAFGTLNSATSAVLWCCRSRCDQSRR
jgi:hypothetical protein